MVDARSRLRVVRFAAAAVATLLIGAVVGWAGATVLTPPRDVSAETPFTYVDVVEGEVGSSINLNTVAEWTLAPVGTNLAAGTVTSVNVEAGQEVGAGATLYTVNLRPTVVAAGAIPAFQPLAQGAKGADVAQLQSFLSTLGFYTGAVNGTFAYSTAAAVKAWQKSLGIAVDGVVQAGDIVYVPTLPTRVALDAEKVRRGAQLSGGEEVVSGLPPTPQFSVPVSESQAALIPSGTVVEITGPDGQQWTGHAGEQTADEFSTITVSLLGVDDTTICGADCGTVPVTGETFLSSRVVTVPTVTGLRVPSAALLSKADGSIVVIDREGAQHEVTVVTSARGMSIIEGVSAGMSVRVPVGSQ